MLSDLHDLLNANPLVVLFLIVGFGYLIGNIRIAGTPLGEVTGVLVVGLLFGHLDLAVPEETDTLGFILFIYCIGIQAGPQFIHVFRRDGGKYFALALITAVTAYAVADGLSIVFGFQEGTAAGMLAGGLTSSATLVAALDALQQAIDIPAGLSRDAVASNVFATYAITYVFGMAGLVVVIGLMPRLLRIDLATAAQELGAADGLKSGAGEPDSLAPAEAPVIRAYRVTNAEIVGRPIGSRESRESRAGIHGDIQKVKRGGDVFLATAETELAIGDIVAAVGLQSAHENAPERIGPEVIDRDVVDIGMDSWNVMVTSGAVEGRTLSSLAITDEFGCWLTKFSRAGVDLPLEPELRIQIGDTLLLTGVRPMLESLAENLGHVERRVHETDLVTFAFGIALGILLGTFSVTLAGVSIGLGTAGGVLISGLTFGLLRSYRPTFGRVPSAARYVLMELGLLMFMAHVGLTAGGTIVATFSAVGPTLMLSGMVVTLVPVFVAFAVGRLAFKMNPALLLGAITGAMTSTAALKTVTALSRSEAPTFGYVGSYTFANIFLAVAGGVIMRL